MAHYTKDQLRNRINAGIKGKIGVLVDSNETMNQVIRSVATDIDLRSLRRMATIQGGIFDTVIAYPAPPDLKASKLISLSKQAESGLTYFPFNLVPYEQFNTRRGFSTRFGDNPDAGFRSEREPYTVAFDDQSQVRRLLIAVPVDGVTTTISSLDSLSQDSGVWAPFVGGGAINLVADSGNRIYGVASLRFDISAIAATTAGIQHSALDPFNISDCLNSECSFLMGVYLSNAEDITDIRLRVGNDSSNYFEMVATETQVNTAFDEGWNIVRFSLANRTEVGAVDPTSLEYVAVFMTKDLAKISQSSFRFDHIVLARGDLFEVRYYSIYGWQSVEGVWKVASDEDDDIINADSDEFELYVNKGIEFAGQEVDEIVAAETARNRYNELWDMYIKNNPSEALIETSDYQAQYYI